MRKSNKLVVCFWALCVHFGAYSHIIPLGKSLMPLQNMTQPCFYVTKDPSIDINVVSSPDFSDKFSEVFPKTLDSDQYIWYKFTAFYESEFEEPFVFIVPAITKSIELYEHLSEGEFKVCYAGLDAEDEDRILPGYYNYLLFHASKNPKTYYIRIKPFYPPYKSLYVASLDFIYRIEKVLNLVWGILLGGLVVLFLYFLITYQRKKTVTLLLHTMYLGSALVYALSVSNVQYSILYPHILSNFWVSNAIYHIPFHLNFLVLAGYIHRYYSKHFIWSRSTQYISTICLILLFANVLLINGRSLYSPHLLTLLVFVYYSWLVIRSFTFSKYQSLIHVGMMVLCLCQLLLFELSKFNDIEFFGFVFLSGCLGLHIMGGLCLVFLHLLDEKEHEYQAKDTQTKLMVQLAANQALKEKHNLELQEKIELHTKELNERNSQLDSLIYQTAHEVRGPIKSILGVAQVGMMEYKDQKLQEYFKHVSHNAQKMDSSITSLVHLSKINNQEFEKNRIDFYILVNEVLGEMEQKHVPFLKVNLKIQPDLYMYGDLPVIRSILIQLIEFSIGFKDNTKKDNHLRIEIYAVKEYIYMILEDNGRGIPESRKDKIFDMYYKGTTKDKSVGIGLYLVKNAVEKLGGAISFISKEGVGTIFILNIRK